ncbi:unnamed protein product [Arctogadus glacialis]
MGPLPDAVSRSASKPRLIASEPLAGDATDRCCGVVHQCARNHIEFLCVSPIRYARLLTDTQCWFPPSLSNRFNLFTLQHN